MNDEARKSLEWADDERALWEAGRAEEPDPEAEARLLRSLGLETPGPGGGEPGVFPSGVRPESVVAPRRPFVKWAVLGVVAVGVPLLFVFRNTDGSKVSARSEPPVVVAPQSSPGKTAVVAPEASPSGVVALQDLSEEKPASGAAQRSPNALTKDEPAAKAPSLSEELAFVRKARSEVSAGELVSASATLDAYQAAFSKPRLGAEATVLRVEILMKRGETAAAKKLAAPLLTSGSPYQKRLETLLGNP